MQNVTQQPMMEKKLQKYKQKIVKEKQQKFDNGKKEKEEEEAIFQLNKPMSKWIYHKIISTL